MFDPTSAFKGAYLKLPGQSPMPIGVTHSWGAFTRYLAIGDDQFAEREVDLYENGYGLIYDRENWTDKLGGLADARFDERWIINWGEPERIEVTEFKLAMMAALASPAHTLQAELATCADKTPWPVPNAWLRRNKSP